MSATLEATEVKFKEGDRVRGVNIKTGEPISGFVSGVGLKYLKLEGRDRILEAASTELIEAVTAFEDEEATSADLTAPAPVWVGTLEAYEAEGQAVHLDMEIADLYQQVTEAEATANAAARAAAQLYWQLGGKLSQKKAELGHGEWLPFLESVGIAKRTAQRAMQLNQAYPESDTLTHLTLTQALAGVQVKKPQQAIAPTPKPAAQPAETAAPQAEPPMLYGALAEPDDAARKEADEVARLSRLQCSSDWKPVANPRRVRFPFKGAPIEGEAVGVLVKWGAGTVSAVLIDHEQGQVQVPFSQVEVIDDDQ